MRRFSLFGGFQTIRLHDLGFLGIVLMFVIVVNPFYPVDTNRQVPDEPTAISPIGNYSCSPVDCDSWQSY